MRKSTSFLPDINVWLALASRRHIHHGPAAAWFDTVDDGGAAFCRITQMGLLRLLTNRKVMGPDTITQARAWQLYERMCRDARVRYLEEPPGVEREWRRLSRLSPPGQSSWTDSYLLAFARAYGLRLATFDRGLGRRGAAVVLLPARG